MAMKADKRFSVKTDMSVFKRLGRGNQENMARNHQAISKVCKYWLEGRCTRNPCRFLHPDVAKPNSFKYSWKNPGNFKSENSPPIEKARRIALKSKVENGQSQSVSKTQKLSTSEVKVSQCKSEKNAHQIVSKSEVDNGRNPSVPKTEQKLLTCDVNVSQSNSITKKHTLCHYWATENCTKGEMCENLHSWFYGDGLSMVARLEGHIKDITGIALPSGSNKLYCGSKDKSLRVWDCNSGQCVGVIEFDCECATLVKEGPWIFAGLQDMIKAWNLNTQHELVIRGSGGRVNSITMFNDILFAGMEDGTILSWKSTSETSFSEVATSLKGHTGSVLSLVIGAKRLYSGSADNTIRVWDAESLQCMFVLNGHTDDVTAVLCWDQYLLSGSLDKKIKVWAATENGSIEEVYKHDVDDGVVAFCGMHDVEGKPILLCSCKDNSVGLYDLPSFEERGRVFSRRDVEAIEVGPEGLFFTGDAAGLVSVWKLNGKSTCELC